MKKLYLLIFFFTLSSVAYSQKKQAKPTTYQALSISNIKLGMSMSDFLTKYSDSIQEQSEKHSTKTLMYESLIINDIPVSRIIVKFYKGKLMTLSFHTGDFRMHSGLSAKYGYNSTKEFSDYDDGVTRIIGGYGKRTDNYDFFRVQYDNGEPDHFIMMDLKANKLADAEGF